MFTFAESKIILFDLDMNIFPTLKNLNSSNRMISEIGLAVKQKLTASEIADFIHPYPSYSFAIFQICGKVATENMLASTTVKFLNWWKKK